MYNTVIFDFGNTLAQSASLADSLEQVLGDSIGYQVGTEIENEIMSLYKPDQKEQPDWLDIWARCFSNNGIKFRKEVGYKHLENFCRSNVTFPETIKTLTYLKAKGFKLGLLSNATGPAEVFDKDLADRGIADFFDSVVWSCDIGFRKPYSSSFKYILSALKSSPCESLMIGDSEIADIEGANLIGMDSARMVKSINERTRAKYKVVASQMYEDILAITNTTCTP